MTTSSKVWWAWVHQAQSPFEQIESPANRPTSKLQFYILQSAFSVGRIIVKMEDSGSQSVRSASQEISTEFKTLVDSQDLDSIKQSQNLILGRLQDSNAVLSHFNEYSENCFADVSADFSRNTRLLRSMKSDLDYIFQKLRSLKAKIMETYPDAFPDDSAIEALDQRPDLELPR